MFRIDNSKNDAPYQGIHIYDDNTHIGTFHEDDAPVPDFNRNQRTRAMIVCVFMNGEEHDQADRKTVFNAFKHMEFIK